MTPLMYVWSTVSVTQNLFDNVTQVTLVTEMCIWHFNWYSSNQSGAIIGGKKAKSDKGRNTNLDLQQA